MSDKVQKALRERAAKKRDEEQKEKYSFYKESRDRVDKALEDRKTRIQSNVGSIASDILGRYESAVSSYDSYLSQNSSLASGTYSEGINLKSVLDDQRERSLAVSKLIRDIEAHRSYLGDEITDKALTGLKGMSEGYEHIRTKAELFSKYKTEDEYNADVEEWNNYYNKWGHYADAEDFETTSSNRNFVNPTDDDFAYYDAMMNYDSWRTDANGKMYDAFGNEIPYVADDKGNIIHPMQNDSRFAVSDPLGLFLSTSEDERENLVYGTQYGKKFETLREGVANHWEMLEDDEVALYYSILNKKGQDEALKYLRDTAEMLNSRWGALRAKEIQNIDNGFIKTLSTGMLGLEAGLDQWSTGVAQIIEGETLPTSGVQFASAEMANSLEGLGKYAYNATVTVGNMLPSILTSKLLGMAGVGTKLAQGVGAVTVGASAGGNAYGQALKEGYGESQAQTYGVLVGASEAALQYLIGGIGSLGGVSSAKLLSKVKMIDNSLLRLSARYGISIGSEIAEEELQLFLEPAFKSIIFGEDYDAPTMEEMLETAIVTALSTGVLEGGSTIATDIAENSQLIGQGKDIMKAEGGVDALRDLAMDVVRNSSQKTQDSITKLSDKVSGENVKARTVGKLYQATKDAATEQNKADIVKSLERKGYTSKEADTIADILVTQYTGENITQKQFKKVESLESEGKIRKTIEDVVLNDASTAGQRSGNINLFDYGVANGVGISTNVSTTQKNIDNKALKNEAAKVLKEKEIEVADDGKTTNLKTDMAVEVKNIANISESGEINLTLDDGMVVKASDLSFGSEAEAVFVANIGNIKLGKKNISTASANALYQAAMTALKTNPKMTASEAMSLIKGLEESYTYGAYNFGESNLTKSESVAFASELTEEQRKFAYELGSQDRVSEVERDQKAIDELKAKGKPSKSTTKKGKVRFEEGVVAKGKLQKRTVSLAKHLASAVGIDIVFYDARTTTNEEGKGANGYFDEATDTIYLDLQNSYDDSKTIAFTLSHELVHFIKKWSPEKFNTLAKFLTAQYTEHGVDSSKLLAKKMADLGTEDKDLAYEEMICDACETMLLDSNAVYKLMELRKTDLELFDKIKLHIYELLNKIRNMYKSLGLSPTSDEAKALLGMQDVLEQMYSLFEEAAVDAAQNYQAVGTLETESVSVSEDGTIKMQMKQYQQTGRATLLNYLKEQYGAADANDLISTIDNIYNAMAEIKKDTALSVFGNWQDTEVELDENGHPIFTTSINNGDYKLNQDFSRVCKKRRQLDFVLNMLAEDPAFEASNLTKDDIVKINKAIKEHGFEIACALCFVDSKRFRQTEWADSFANTWNDILYSVVGDKSKLTPFNFATKNPNLVDDGIEIDTSKPVMYRKWSDGKEDVKNRKNYDSFDSMLEKKANGKFVEGNANVRAIVKILKENPHLRHTFRGADIIGSQGFDTIQRLAPNIRGILDGWGGTSVPKPSSNDAIYDNSVLNIAGYNAKSAFAIGGVRMNSFSDFMAHMFFDYVQAFADLSAKGLPMHSYTKELDFARLFGLTKGKINMSAIAAIRENATDLNKIKKKADKDKATEWEKSIAGLDISKVAEKLGKAEADITYDDIIQNLDACEYVWADESIDVRSATLLQSGIMYDNLTEGKAAYCYELIKEGKFEEAFKVAGEKNVNRDYAKHLGIITVGVSKAHILKLLRDPTIRMVIPYHKSGLNAQVAAALKIAFYEDFTDVQNTMLLKADGSTVGLSKDGAKIGDKNIGDFNFYKYFGKTIDGVFYDGKATAAKYIEWCEKGEYNESVGEYGYYLTDGSFITKAELDAKGLSILPKFNEFAEEENYYKLVEDFDCYDTITGEHSPQEAVDLFHDGLPADYKAVLTKALKAEQKVSDDFRDHLDNHGLRDEVMEIVKPRGYTPSVKKQAKKKNSESFVEDKYFKSQMQKWESLSHGGYVKVGEIKEDHPLVKVGMPQGTIKYDVAKLKANIGKHEYLNTALLNEIPNIIANPIAISEYTEENTVSVFGDVFVGSSPMMVGVTISKDRSGANISKVRTFNARRDVGTLITDETVLYLNEDKKRTLNWFQACGIQVPLGETKFGFIRSISQKEKTVKKQVKKDSEGKVLSAEQQEFFKDSKVRDAEGNLLVCYHGTPNGGFTEFQLPHYLSTLTSAQGAGYYFTDKQNAKQYMKGLNGKSVSKKALYKVYLNITNPLEITEYSSTGAISDDAFRRIMARGNYEWGMSHTDVEKILRVNKFDSDRLAEMVRVFNGEEILTVMKEELGYDGVRYTDKYGDIWVAWDKSQIKDTTNKTPTSNPDIRYQKKRITSYAPTFYSQMGKVVEGVKQEKLAANSVVNMLRGKGVKAEEIRWSGIAPFLEGKKSVTKQELLDFINGSMLQIGEVTRDNKEIPYDEYQLSRISSYEREREGIVDELKTEWKRVFGKDISIQHFGAGLESAVVNAIYEAERDIKNTQEVGKALASAREELKKIFDNDDFGYDSSQQAYKAAVRDPEDFMYNFDLSTEEVEIFERFIRAKVNFRKAEGVSLADKRALKDIANKADGISNMISKVKNEHYTEAAKYMTKWRKYTLDGGENYREIVFTLPNSNYSNEMMKTHWDEDAKGVLVHARIQDFDVNGKKMLFIEEIQSDWHNEGHKDGYQDDAKFKELQELEAKANEAFYALEDYSTELTGLAGEHEAVAKTQKGRELLRAKIRAEKELKQAQAQIDSKVPDAPFKENYHEFVLKRLLRMAAEQGYDSIGWTTAQTQDERWNDHQAHEEGKGVSGNLVGYTIEYDQDMPKFLRKYGRQWGAKVDKTKITTRKLSTEEEMELAFIDDMMSEFERDFTRGNVEIWSMDITDSMKDSVLHEGQALFQKKRASNRSILANSLESAAQNDIERNKLAEYKKKIALIESEESRLSEIQKQLFTKGGVDPSQRKDLQFEARQIANRITTYDRQLLNLEATTALKNVLSREKALAMKRQKQKDAEAMRQYKEKVAKTTRELMARNQESRKKAIEGREKTAMRHKIKNVVSELNQLLLRGTKDKHVMIGLQKAVAEALDAVNMDTVGAEERVAHYNDLIAKAKDPDIIASLTATRDRIQAQGDKMSDKLTKLKNAYNDIKNSDDPLIANSHDEVIASRLEYIAEKVGNTPIRDMTLEQLEDVYDMYKMVLTTIRNSNKSFKNAKNESIATLGNRVMMEVEEVGGKKKLRRKGTEGIEKFAWNNLKPIYAFNRIGSDTLTEVFNNVRAGEDTWAVDVTEAREYYLEQSKKHNYDSWDFKKRYKFTSTSGMDFELSLEQIMSLYAYSKREQAAEHLRKGGIVFDETTEVTIKNKLGIPMKFNPTEATAYNLSVETLADIVGKLTNEQRAFVDEMQAYLSDVMGEKGNEVSLEMYGVKLFKEKFYFPLKSATQFMAKAKEQQQGEVKIKNSGFSKETVQKASNPIVLTPFMDVWANHVNEMSMYHSFVLPMEDFYRVFNYKTPTSDTMATESVEMFIQNAYGKGATQYIEQLLKDLNGGAVSDPRETFSKAFMSKFKKASVMASLSVIVQQPTALIRAMALVGMNHFGIAPITRGIVRTVIPKKHKALWAEVKKYAPIAIIKEMGRFDTHMGQSVQDYIKSEEYKGLGKVKGFFTDSNYRDDMFSKLPAIADEMAWVSIWNAVKRETIAKHKDLKPNSEEFLKIVGERFTEVITKTQVYDSVLARSANMRAKSTFMNMWTSFMAEPTTSINMLEDALRQGKRGNKKYVAKAIGAVYGSVILNAALVSLVYAMRDDDEDETFLEKYASRLTTELLDGINPLTYIPFLKDVWSIAQGFDIERADMSLITDLVDTLQQTVEVMSKNTEDMDEDELAEHQKEVAGALWGIADSISSLVGLPTKNIRRDINGATNLFDTIIKDKERETTAGSLLDEIWEDVKSSIPVVGWLPNETKQDKLYDAIINGDSAYIDRLKSGYKDDKAYETAVRKALRENDSRIREAAEARIDGDIAEYSRIVKAIKAEGFFSQDTIVASVNAEINALNKGEGSDSSSDSNKVKSMYKMDDYFMALDGGDEATAYVVKEDLIETDVANGKDREEAEESFNGKFTSYIREQYEEGGISDYEAQRMLVNYGDKTEDEASSKVQYWAFKQEYPDYDDLSEEAVTKYYEKVEPYGITVGVYYDYSKQRSKCKGTDNNGDGKTDSGSVKAEVLWVIHSLPLTYAQKDALYYLNGWSAKTIYEAPWH